MNIELSELFFLEYSEERGVSNVFKVLTPARKQGGSENSSVLSSRDS